MKRTTILEHDLEPELVRGDGGLVDTEEALGGKIVGILFAAAFVPACTAFVARLKTFYDIVNADGQRFEVVLCSMDKTATDFEGCFGDDAKWLAIPFHSIEREGVSNKYSPPGMPTLTIIKVDGSVIELEGDAMIESGTEALAKWKDAYEWQSWKDAYEWQRPAVPENSWCAAR